MKKILHSPEENDPSVDEQRKLPFIEEYRISDTNKQPDIIATIPESTESEEIRYPEIMDCPSCCDEDTKNSMREGICTICGYTIAPIYRYFHGRDYEIPLQKAKTRSKMIKIGILPPHENKELSPEEKIQKIKQHIAGIFFTMRDLGFIQHIHQFPIRRPRILHSPDEKMEYLLTKMLKKKQQYTKLLRLVLQWEDERQYYFIKQSRDLILLMEQCIQGMSIKRLQTSIHNLSTNYDPESWDLMYALSVLLINPEILQNNRKELDQYCRMGRYIPKTNDQGSTYAEFQYRFPALRRHIQSIISYQQEILTLLEDLPE